MSTKILLKSVAEAIKLKKYDDAAEQAREVLKKDAKSYQA